MDAQSARQYVLAQPLKLEPVATPFWSNKDSDGNELGLDGSVYLQDIPGDILMDLQNTLSTQQALLMGAMLVKALVVKDKNVEGALPEPLFQDVDRSSVAHLGSTILLPIFQQLQVFFGLDQSALDAVKKG